MAQPAEPLEQPEAQPSLALVPDFPSLRLRRKLPPRMIEVTDDWTGKKFWITMLYYPGWIR